LLVHWTLVAARPTPPGMDRGPNPYPVYDGAVRYDWEAGRIVQFYPGLDSTADVVVSPDARRLYVLHADGAAVFIECAEPPCGTVVRDRVRAIDVQTGTTVMEFDGASRFIAPAGGGPSRVALSGDGRTLYLNESAELLIFSTLVAGPAQVVRLNPDHPLTSFGSAGPGWVMDAAAKEWGGPGVAADPSGRWVVSLGRAYQAERLIDNERDLGFWVVNLQDHPRVVGYFHRSDGFRAVAASSDGRVIYLLEESGRGRYLLMVDPATGKDLGELLLCTSTACDGFDAIIGVTPAG
jgi:DNA-binding beta-propeller fold protein YncE